MKNKAFEKEKKRIYSILEKGDVSENKKEALESIIIECAFIRQKLDMIKDEIQDSNVTIPYDNGGNQKGIRENPLFKGYESLFKTYLMAMDRIIAVLPKSEQDEVRSETSGDNVLELVRSMHKESV